MPADIRPPAEIATLTDALGREVTAVEAPSGLLVILTRTPQTGLNGGHPALNRELARELGAVLVAWADDGESR